MSRKNGMYINFIKFYCILYQKNFKIFSKILYKFNKIIFSNDIPPTVKIGKNLLLPHYGLGVVIHPRTVIGDNVTIYQNVTIGSRNKVGPPLIEDNVLIGAGACVLGKIVVASGTQIGANAVVVKDTISDKVYVGVPAKEVGK